MEEKTAVEHLRSMHRFLEETDRIESSVRTLLADHRARVKLYIGVDEEKRRRINELLDQIAAHPEITNAFGWKRKALTYGTDVIAKDHVPTFVEATKQWLEIYGYLKEISEHTNEPNFREMVKRLSEHAENARKALEFFENNPHAIEQYYREMKAFRRAKESLDEFEEL